MQKQVSAAAIAPSDRAHRCVDGARRLSACLVLAALFVMIGQALAGPNERVFVPQRAPEHLRAAALRDIDIALARHLTADTEIDDADLAAWLHHRGRSLSELLRATGLDPARLVRNAVDVDDAVGGPFIALGAASDAERTLALDYDLLVDRVLETVPLATPVRDPHRLTSGYGQRRDPFRGRAAFHRGIDMAAPRGTPIYAPAGGTVVRAGRMGGFGNVVEIDHGNGVQTRYAHLHAYLVRRGAEVAAGTQIGRMGRSGRATGVHLHYEVLVDGRHVDPARFLSVGRQLAAHGS